MTPPHLISAAVVAAVTAVAFAAGGLAQTGPVDPQITAEPPIQTFSGPPENPRRHFRVADPAALSPADAQTVYDDLRPALARRYAASGDPSAGSYQAWKKFNTLPYGSMTHGRRFVNNYANGIAESYGEAERAGRLPVGAVVAKDSFVVTQAGDIQPGPLFLMEKMPAGFNYVTGDWRYSMVTAAGELAGRTGGPDAERVEFCIACHLAQEEQDHLFFVPPAFRPNF